MELHKNLFLNSALATIIISDEGEIIDANAAAFSFFGSDKNSLDINNLNWLKGIISEVTTDNISSGFKTFYLSTEKILSLFYIVSHAVVSDKKITSLIFTNAFKDDTKPGTDNDIHQNGKSIVQLEGKKAAPTAALDTIIDKEIKQAVINASEEKYRMLVQQASEPFIITTADGNILEANEASCNFLGYTQEEYSRMNVRDVIVKEELLVKPVMENELRQGMLVKNYRRLRHKNGTIISSYVTSKMMSDGRIVVIARDMTEWNEAQQIIKETAQKLNNAQRVAGIGSWTFDSKTNKLEWSDEIFRIFGMNKNDHKIEYETFLGLLHPEDRGYVIDTYKKSVADKTIYDINHRIITSDGTIKYVNEKCETQYDENGVPLISSGTVQDITERKIIEEALIVNEKQLDLIYNATSAIIYLIEVRDGRFKFISANKAGLKATGLKPEQFFNKFIEEVIPESSLDFIKQKYNEAIKNRSTVSWEEETNYPNGKKIWVISITPVFDNNGHCTRLVGTIQDITDVKEASERILKEKDLSDAIIKNLPGVFFLFNKEGKFLRWNKNFEEFSVYSREEIATKNPLDFVEPEDRERVQKVIEAVFINGNAELEATLLNRNGELVPMYFTGWLANFEDEPCVIGMALDISERKKAELELRKSEQKFNSLVNTIDGVVWEADAESLQYTFVSRQAEKLLGFPVTDWTEDPSFLIKHLHPNDKEMVLDYFKKLRIGHKPHLLEYRMITVSGKTIWLEDIVAVIKENNNPTVLRGVLTDISDRKQKELELKDSHEKYTAIINNSMNAFLLASEQGDIIDTNQTAREMFGYTAEELSKMKTDDIFDPNYPKYKQGVELRKKTGKGVGEVFGLKKNGEKIPLAFTSSVFYNAAGEKLVSAIGIDISDRIKYEENLLKSNERFEKVSEATFDAIWDWNVRSHELYLGEGFKELFGYDIKNNIGQFSSWSDHIHPDDKDKIVLSRLNKIIKYDEDKWRDEYRFIRADGTIAFVLDRGILLRENGLTYRMIGAMQDISNSKIAEAELIKSNERFLYVSRATFDAIWDWDLETDELYWGEGFEQLFGYHLKDNKGDIKGWYEQIHPDDRERVVENINKIINSGEDKWKDDYRYLKADGTYAYVSDKGIIIRNDSGKAYRMIGAMRDITSRKIDEEKLNQLNKELEFKAEQLSISNAELESFAYVTSHDLQEPLRMVSSFLQLLQKKYEDIMDEKGQKYINFAIDGSERMKILIQDLLEFSRINSSREVHTQVDLNEISRKVTSNLRRVIEESGSRINTTYLPTIYGNESQMLQLFQNLVGNAIKYRSLKSPVIHIGYKESEEEWEFYVRDNGIGIDPKFFNKIFVIFQRLHNRKEYDGTGIGLAICKKIIEFHGGRIWVESNVGEGSTFYLTISKNLI